MKFATRRLQQLLADKHAIRSRGNEEMRKFDVTSRHGDGMPTSTMTEETLQNSD